jgi:hypothetical protein
MSNDKEYEGTVSKCRKNMWEKFIETLFYPIERILQSTKIRVDAHIWIEIETKYGKCTIKLCVITIWIILYIIYNKI